MHATFLKRWFGLGVSIAAAATILLLTQNLMSVSAQSDENMLISAQADQETIGEEAEDGFRERERFLSSQTFPLVDATGQEISTPEASQSSSLMYVENVGQFDENARFQLRGSQGTVHFIEDAIWITFLEPTTDDVCQSNISQDCDLPTSSEGLKGHHLAIDQKSKPPTVKGVHLKLSFAGSNPNPRIIGFDPLPTTVSYLMGNDPNEWRPDVPVYGGIRYEEVYPNIDIEFSGENGNVLPKIITRPGADLTRVAIEVEGGKVLKLEDGLLTLETEIGPFEWPLFAVPNVSRALPEPILGEQTVQFPFTESGLSQLVFNVSDLIYSTYLGGGSDDTAGDIAIDLSGAAYVVGRTQSITFPVTSGVFQTTLSGTQDIFVAKLTTDGSTFTYATFIGGGSDETGEDIVVDSSGQAYITGNSVSEDFPTTAGALQTSCGSNPCNGDAIVVKLNADGTDLIYSTYLGGSAGWDYGSAIEIGESGTAYVTGHTSSGDFPTTSGAWDELYNGVSDVFVTKLNATGSALVYSTFLGSDGQDNSMGIAVDTDGYAYVTGFMGSYTSVIFPTTTGAYNSSCISACYFVTKLNATGTALSYSTFLGSNASESCCWGDIAVNSDGEAYVTSDTDNPYFPTTLGAFQTQFPGFNAVFVTKFNATGNELIYSTFLGTGQAYAIDLHHQTGDVYVVGSGDIPITPGNDQQTFGGFVARLDNNGSTLLYSTDLFGAGISGIVVDSGGATYLTGSASSNFPTTPGAADTTFNGVQDVFIIKLDATSLPIYPGQDWNVECPFCNVNNTQGVIEGIHPRSGSFVYGDREFSIPFINGELTFDYSYISAAIDVYTTTMGYGWTHNYDMQLHFTSTVPTHTVILQAPGGSRFPYFGNGDGSYTRYPGVTAEMERIDGVNPSDTRYIVTTFNQFIAIFDADGNFINQIDPAGHVLTLTYDSGLLDKVKQGSRYLEFTYDGSDRVETVTDNFDRMITMTYTGNDLTGVADPLNRVTTYEYDGAANLLTEIVDASGRTVKEILYDNENRAYTVKDGEGNILVYINYGNGGSSFGSGRGFTFNEDLSATRLITASGVVMTYTYDARGTLVDITQACTDNLDGCQASSGSAYDYNFKHDEVVDENGNASSLNWSAGGSNLEEGTDALGHSTSLTYDNLNNLTEVVNARGYTTTYAYDDANFPSFRTRMTDTLGNVTIYTATISATDGISGLIKAEKDPNGVVTAYDYNEFGQITRTVRAVGTADAVTTTYGYDEIGRLITTTQTSALESHTSLNVYDDADQLLATVANWTGTEPANWQTDCANGTNETNICTRYKYDEAGRTISTTNALSQTNLTFYDEAGRVVTSVVNYDGTTAFSQLCTDFTNPDPEYNICSLTGYDGFGRAVTRTNSLGNQSVTEYNVLGRISRTIQNYEDGVFDANDPDTDIQTLYKYDNAGNTIIVTDTLTRTTRTFYNELNRVVGTVTNWQGEISSTITAAESLQNCFTLPENRDYDICTLYEYDEVGNTIIVTDALGRMTRTFYDELGRVLASVQNWNPDTLTSPTDCNLSPGNTDPDNICTRYGYNDAGNQITTTNALSQTSLTVYDEANRAVIRVANWDGTTAISADGTGCADTAADPTAEANLCTSITGYDQLGRRAAVTDTLGLLTTFEYDGLGRVVTTTRYLGSQPVTTTTDYDALGNRLSQTNARGYTTTYQYDSLNRVIVTTSPEGVAITQTYNAAGWVITTTDSLGHSTINEYDNLGRVITTTDALGNQTLYEYNALGNKLAMIDAEGVKTTYVYDGLNRLVQVIENDVASPANSNEEDVTTEYVYDALGNRVLVINAREISFTQTLYDGLNRPVVITDAVGNETQYLYNALGSQVVMTDGNGAVTQYTYDDFNRLTATAYLSDSETVSYNYDAAGNRLVMTDSLGVTGYKYDEFYRLISVTNPFSGTVLYSYDLVGNRTHLTYPDSKVVIYTYDGDNRLVAVEDWDTGLTAYDYDPAGRLVTTTLPNGVETTYGYDDANRLTSLIHRDNLGELLARYLYQLDQVGNRIVVTETVATPGGESLAALTGVQDNLLAGHEGPVTSDVVLAAVTGAGPADDSRPIAQAKPTTNIARIPYPWAMNAAELALVPPERAGAASELTVRLARTTLTADGRDGTHIVALVTDDRGQPVADGTRVFFQAASGQVRPAQAATTNGLVFAWLTGSQEAGPGQVTAYSDVLTATADFTLVAPVPGSLRLGEATAGSDLPVELAELVERAQNTIETPAGEPPYIVRASHQAEFGSGRLDFTVRGETPTTLTIELVSVAIGQQVLFDGPAGAIPAVSGNVAAYNRGPNLVEEFVARDSGIEQQWHIEQPPQTGGDLVIAIEVETTLALAPAPGGEGFIFRAVDPITGGMVEVAHYGRAVAFDATGDTIPAGLSFETVDSRLVSTSRQSTTYRIFMTFPADWLAEATYPILVDPLIGSAVQLDEGGIEADQSQPAVAYNSTDDEFLVVWQDDRNGTDDIFAQRVDGDGNLVGDNLTVNAAGGSQTLPDVAYNPDQNSYLVVWRDGTEAIRGQAVENDGDLLGTVRNLADSAVTRNYPAVSYSSSDNAWLTAWQEWDGGTSSYRLQARAVKGSTGALQTTFTVYSDGSDSVTPDVSANSSGGFLVVWEQTVISDTDIYARRAISTAVDGGTIVLTSTTDAQVAPAVTYNPDDDEYLVAWQDLAGSKDTIWARQVTGITATNPFVGNAFQVNPGTFNAQAPAVTYFTPGVAVSGTYLVVWERPAGGDSNLTAQWVLTDTTKTSAFSFPPAGPNEPAGVALGYGPSITATLAAWTSELGGHYDVAAARIPAGGSAGTAFVVHPQPDYQERPEVAYNPDDEEYLVVWHDYRAGEAAPNIFGQRVSITGTLLGDNITITTAAYRQLYPKVAYGDGVYLVAWTHYPGLADTDFDAYAGIISPTGTVVTNSLVISTGTAPNSQAQPTDIVYNSTSQEFLVLYQDKTVTQFNIWGRHVDSGGSMGSPIQITSQDNIVETNAAGAYNPDDDQYLVVWEDTGNTIYGRRMTGAGVVSTTETIIVANTAVTEQKPDVVYLNDQTGYVVVWSVSTGTSREVYGRVVAANGGTGTTYQVSSGAQGDKLPRLDLDGEGGAMVIWHFRVNFDTDNLYGRRLGSDGQTLGSQFTILSLADTRQLYPALASNGDGQYFLAWQDDRNGNWDIYGQPFQHLTADFSASPTSGPAPLNVSFTDTSQPIGVADEWAWDFGDSGTSASQNPNHTYTSPGEYTVSLTITDTNTGETDTVIKTNYISVVTTGTTSLITTTMVYTYDNLYRLTEAAYSGGITATYEYLYDAAGNRAAYTTTITSTEVITYLYDNANRLIESMVIGGDTTTYTWDNASRLITTTVAGQVSRVYGYSQDGDLITATVDSLVTAFAYDGDGRRLLMSVAGEVTTYTLDYAFSGFRILFEDGPTNDKHYLYGVQCIAEVVDEGTAEEEWRYYQRDGNHIVRQATNETAEVTLAWTYTPEGMVLVGEEGPVTYLDCGAGGIYDWSTGLIFKNGHFFDPTTGIWITLVSLVVWQSRRPSGSRKNKASKRRKFLLFLLCIIILVALSGCDAGNPTPTPTPTQTPCPQRPIIRTGDIHKSSVEIRYETVSGPPRLHKGTAIGENAFLTSNHWLVGSLNDITNWEFRDAVTKDSLGISGTGSDLSAAGPAYFNNAFDLVVFNPALPKRFPVQAQIADIDRLIDNYGPVFEQAVINGNNPGLYEVEAVGWNEQATHIRVQPDSTVGGDSGLGLYKEGALVGVNTGGNGWYGGIRDVNRIEQKINALTASFP